ncbi:hypothetical protein BPAE_0164g00190 [Botrytis paeoniae]|uniref:Uncharacterized protein n=1 Tax=Botrytis paeoniae TaxID=278948 RepID=A0A4Z1FI94_9HELO|nr:hypothetical protein BPAE_0164g00190 [Botrytis paeoniae]
MTNSENKRAKMTFDRVDDTNEAVAAGELPDPAGDKSDLDDSLKDMTKLQVNISGVVDCGMSLLKSVFYKKLAILNMAIKTEAKGKKEESKETDSVERSHVGIGKTGRREYGGIYKAADKDALTILSVLEMVFKTWTYGYDA